MESGALTLGHKVSQYSGFESLSGYMSVDVMLVTLLWTPGFPAHGLWSVRYR